MDHIALKTLMKYDNLTSRRARWMEILVIYFFKIEHRPGKKWAIWITYSESTKQTLNTLRTERMLNIF